MSEAPKREERPRQAARRITKTIRPAKHSTRPERRAALLEAMGAAA